MEGFSYFQGRMGRSGWMAIAMVVWGLSSASGPAAEEKPAELLAARSAYEGEFLRKLESTQGKYQRALEQYKRFFTRKGNLEAAQEAQREFERAELWDTIPVNPGARSMQNPKLDALLKNYEDACLKVMAPITERYKEALLRLKKGYAQTGNLEASLSVKSELTKLAEGKGHPVKKGGLRYLSNLSKQEFGEWLEDQTFEFVGTIAGPTKLKFKGGKVEYGVGTIYAYEVTKTRTVEIIKGGKARGFVMEFSTDLQSATLESARGKYPVRINGKDPINKD